MPGATGRGGGCQPSPGLIGVAVERAEMSPHLHFYSSKGHRYMSPFSATAESFGVSAQVGSEGPDIGHNAAKLNSGANQLPTCRRKIRGDLLLMRVLWRPSMCLANMSVFVALL